MLFRDIWVALPLELGDPRILVRLQTGTQQVELLDRVQVSGAMASMLGSVGVPGCDKLAEQVRWRWAMVGHSDWNTIGILGVAD